MADTEVEDTLREIRERVLANAPVRTPPPAVMAIQNGGGEPPSNQYGDTTEALARMDANLSTTARAWSRLPPLHSNRRGALARFELWLKRLIKRALHWFTWEQVNFNSAAHNALGDARAALDTHERALASVREEFVRMREEFVLVREEFVRMRADIESRAQEFEARVSSAELHFDARLAELQGALASGINNLRGEHRARTDALSEELRNELRDRAEGILEEQRVCFRQLSLEASELSVTQDRARRAVESRLEALEKKQSND